jgi:hypothetical protein
MGDYYRSAYAWARGWQDALGMQADLVECHTFAAAWRDYRNACKQAGDAYLYIRTAWLQWQVLGRIDG